MNYFAYKDDSGCHSNAEILVAVVSADSSLKCVLLEGLVSASIWPCKGKLALLAEQSSVLCEDQSLLVTHLLLAQLDLAKAEEQGHTSKMNTVGQFSPGTQCVSGKLTGGLAWIPFLAQE